MPVMLAAEAGGPVALSYLPLALVLLAAWSAGWAARRMGYPAVLGELLVGIVLGPPLLGVLADGQGLDAIAELGVILMMLYIGTEIDTDDLRRASRAGLLAAIGGFVVPFAGGLLVMLLFGFDVLSGVFVGAAMGVTSLATKSRILADLRLFDTRIAYVLVAGALLSDTATLVLFAGVLSIGEGGATVGGLTLVAARALVFFAIMGVAGVLAPRAGTWLRERFGFDSVGWGVGVLIVGGLLGAALAEVLGLHGILGAFVAGMVLRRGVMSERTTRASVELVERVSIGILAPVFFTTAGFAISLQSAADNVPLLVTIIVVATVGKVLGTALFYLPTGHGWREGLVVGAAMNGRGAVEIVVAGIGLERGLITTEVFTVLVLMAILTTALVPVMLKLGVEWLRGRGELADAGGARRGVTFIGAGEVARAWAEVLAPYRPVWLLDANPVRVAKARAQGLDAVVGDAMDVEALHRARVDEASLVIALTTNAEVNVAAAGLAREEFGVRDVRVARGSRRSDGAEMLLQRAGAAALAKRPVDVGRWSAWMETGDAKVQRLAVDGRTDPLQLQELLEADEGVLALAVLRGEDAIPWPLIDRLRDGDRVAVLVRTRVADATLLALVGTSPED